MEIFFYTVSHFNFLQHVVCFFPFFLYFLLSLLYLTLSSHVVPSFLSFTRRWNDQNLCQSAKNERLELHVKKLRYAANPRERERNGKDVTQISVDRKERLK